MKKDILIETDFPAGMEISFEKEVGVFRFKGKEVKRKMLTGPRIDIKKLDNKIIIKSDKATKRELKLSNTLATHISNIISGLQEDFIYEMEICNVHFPMVVKVEGDVVRIKNFLGEKIDRTAKIFPNAKVEVKGNKMEISSPDIEAAGQTATRIELATKIRKKDRRVFQDGIFITNKPNRKKQ